MRKTSVEEGMEIEGRAWYNALKDIGEKRWRPCEKSLKV
jgi:hypothetical protein